MAELNDRTMKALLDAFDRSDWQEMTVTVGADTLHVSRQASSDGAPLAHVAPPASAAAPLPSAAAATGDADAVSSGDDRPLASATPAQAPDDAGAATPGTGMTIESPSVGLFWRAPSPGAPPFVEVGGRVSAGDALAIVEVMKLMNHVTAPVPGVVTSILVENGDPVEFGQPLLTIDPEV